MHARFDELIRLRARLQALPAIDPPADAWARISARLDADRDMSARRAGGPSGWLALPAVAALVAAVVLVPWSPAGRNASRHDPLPALEARSRRLESLLRAMPSRPVVESVASTATIDALESHIRRVDAELAGEPRIERAHELWQSRVQLLDSLVGMRTAEAVRAGHPVQVSWAGQGGSL